MITREDISPGYQVVQSNHSIVDFIFKFPSLSQHWKETSNSIISLSVPTLNELEKLSQKLKSLGYFVSEFNEPDIGDELTAITVYGTPEVRKKLNYLPLALKKFTQKCEGSTLLTNKSNVLN